MLPTGPFTVQPSKLHPGSFYVSARHDDIHQKEDELKFGYLVIVEDQAKTLAYCLNRDFENSELLRSLKNILSILGTRYI